MTRASRHSDEMILIMLQWRREGRSVQDISRITGKRGAYVRAATNRVLNSDLAESSEPREAVRAAYRGASA